MELSVLIPCIVGITSLAFGLMPIDSLLSERKRLRFYVKCLGILRKTSTLVAMITLGFLSVVLAVEIWEPGAHPNSPLPVQLANFAISFGISCGVLRIVDLLARTLLTTLEHEDKK